MVQAAESLRKTRTRWREIDVERNRLQRRADATRAQLRDVRDNLVPLHAPQVDDTNIEGAWALLTAWARQQATIRARLILEAADAVAVAKADRNSRIGSLGAELLVNDIDLPDDNVAAAAPLVAVALERARGLTERIVADRRRAENLTRQIQAAVEDQQVARLLADLLRSNKFPQWLAAAALDALVADASASLLELSGGQFDLTHDKGEFYVIDHADADSRRSVRTLSGGETFQASLALALALSAQLTTLAAQGAARLDSIFLDEGFGTLDPDTLEVVAETLENLAQGQRMVGVITHVAALAERAPVRFAIRRDSRTSSVVREGA